MNEAILVLDMTNDSIAPEARAVEKRRAILPRTTDKWFLKYWELANEIWQPGQDPVPELYDAQKDTVVHKRRYSGFFDSDLDLTLRELGAETPWKKTRNGPWSSSRRWRSRASPRPGT